MESLKPCDRRFEDHLNATYDIATYDRGRPGGVGGQRRRGAGVDEQGERAAGKYS